MLKKKIVFTKKQTDDKQTGDSSRKRALFIFFCFVFVGTYKKMAGENINNTSDNNHKIKYVPGIPEIIL